MGCVISDGERTSPGECDAQSTGPVSDLERLRRALARLLESYAQALERSEATDRTLVPLRSKDWVVALSLSVKGDDYLILRRTSRPLALSALSARELAVVRHAGAWAVEQGNCPRHGNQHCDRSRAHLPRLPKVQGGQSREADQRPFVSLRTVRKPEIVLHPTRNQQDGRGEWRTELSFRMTSAMSASGQNEREPGATGFPARGHWGESSTSCPARWTRLTQVRVEHAASSWLSDAVQTGASPV